MLEGAKQIPETFVRWYIAMFKRKFPGHKNKDKLSTDVKIQTHFQLALRNYKNRERHPSQESQSSQGSQSRSHHWKSKQVRPVAIMLRKLAN